MYYLLTKNLYTQDQVEDPRSIHTKHFQHIEMEKIANPYDNEGAVTGDIGSKTNFVNLNKFYKSRSRITIDPYNGAGGGGLAKLPNIPYPFAIFRCLVGVDSEIIPNNLFDITFSISVIEHIGQKESGYDCTPTSAPPLEQENLRNSFAKELLRITKPGGITFHTVDHAARNLTFIDNFVNQGWIPLDNTLPPTLDECLNSEVAIRQQVHWTRHQQDLPDKHLHSVLMLGFRKPLN